MSCELCKDGWIATDWHDEQHKRGGTDVKRCQCNPKPAEPKQIEAKA